MLDAKVYLTSDILDLAYRTSLAIAFQTSDNFFDQSTMQAYNYLCVRIGGSKYVTLVDLSRIVDNLEHLCDMGKSVAFAIRLHIGYTQSLQ